MADLTWTPGPDLTWDPQAAAAEKTAQAGFTAGDYLKGLKKGLLEVPGSLTGLADIPIAAVTGQKIVGPAAEALGKGTGLEFSKWAKETGETLSPGAQAAQAKINEAWQGSGADRLGNALLGNFDDLPEAWRNADLKGAGKAILENPGASLMQVVESAPGMIAGGAIGKGVAVASKVAPWLAGGIGEGAITAGQQMDQTADTVDPRRSALTSLAAGVGTGLIGAGGGRLAGKLGFDDLQTAMAGGAAGSRTKLLPRIAGGAAMEAAQELPQSMQETAWQNFAEGNPLGAGVIRSGVEGAMAGAVMGGGAGLRPRARQTEPAPSPADTQTVTPADTQTVTPEDLAGANASLAGLQQSLDDYQAMPSVPLLPERPAVIPVTNPTTGATSTLDPLGGPLESAAAGAVAAGVSDAANSPNDQSVLFPFANPRAAQEYVGRQADPEMYDVIPHPRDPARTAVVPKTGAALQDLLTRRQAEQANQAAVVRNEALRQEEDTQAEQEKWARAPNKAAVEERILGTFGDGSRGGVKITPRNDGGFDIRVSTQKGASKRSSESGFPPGTKIQEAIAAVAKAYGGFTSSRDKTVAKATAAEKAKQSADTIAADRAQDELAPAPVQPVTSLPGVQQQAKTQAAAAVLSNQVRGEQLASEETPDSIDLQAQSANPSPTEGQKKAGNYAHGHITVGGLDISVETPAGAVRSGVEAGKRWKVKNTAHYGYVKRTTGADSEQVDVYVKPGTAATHDGQVFVVDQYNPATGEFDEHKAMIGYGNAAAAAKTYDAHFSDKSGAKRRGAVTAMTLGGFKTWLKKGDTARPVSGFKFGGALSDTAQAAQQEIAQSTGAQFSLPRSAQKPGESDADFLLRRAAATQAKKEGRDGQVTPRKPPTKAWDQAVVREAFQQPDDAPISILSAESRPDAGQAKGVSKQAAQFIVQAARVFGKRVVFFDVPDRGAAEGFHVQGDTIYLNVHSSTQHLRVLGHELTHAMKRQAGEAYEKMLSAVAALRTDAEMVAQYQDYFGKALNDAKRLDQRHEGGPQTLREFLAEEWMADLSGNRFAEGQFWTDVFTQLENQHGEKAAKGIIARVRMALVAALNKIKTLIGGNAFAVDARLGKHLDEIRKAVATGFAEYARLSKAGQLEAAAGGDTKFAKAFHGTPHAWEPEPGFPHGRPRLDKMGTGEGAQAYGWGWYSAEARDAAESYRNFGNWASRAKAPPVRFKGEPVRFNEAGNAIGDFPEALKRFLERVASKGDYNVALREIESTLAEMKASGVPESWQTDLANEIEQAKDNKANIKAAGQTGNLYQLDIPDDVMPHLLDWDKPLSEQTPEVERVLRDEFFAGRWREKVHGEQLYRQLSASLGDEATSKRLARSGIPGLRYLDSQSRGGGASTYNYVIWDQKVLDRIALLERNGEKLDAMRAAFSTQRQKSTGKENKTQTAFVEAVPSEHTRAGRAVGALSDAQKSAFTQHVFGKVDPAKVVRGVLRRIDARVEVLSSTGGYQPEGAASGKISPNVLVQVTPTGNRPVTLEEAVRVAQALNYVYTQDGVPVSRYDDRLLDIPEATSVVRFTLPGLAEGHAVSAQEEAFYRQLEKVYGVGIGYSKIDGKIVVGDYSGLGHDEFHRLAERVAAEAGITYEFTGAEGDYVFHDWKDDSEGSRHEVWRQADTAGRPNLPARLHDWRDGAVQAAAGWLDERGIKYSPGRRTDTADGRYVGSESGRADSGQGGPSDRRNEPQGRVDLAGVHFSKEPRTWLSGIYFDKGTGAKSQEAVRIRAATDERIKSRIYAYVSEGKGVFPEDDVGRHAHAVKFDNLYDLSADPLDIRPRYVTDKNDMESAILDAGFDGYYARGAFGNQGVAILMGRAATRGIAPDYRGTEYRGKDQDTPAIGEASHFGKQQQAITANRGLPDGEMTGADWKRLMPRLMPDIDVSHLDDAQKYYKNEIAKRPAKLSPARLAMQWESQTTNEAGPVYRGKGFELRAVRKLDTETDFPENDALPWGHAAFVRYPAYRFAIVDQAGNSAGFLDAEVNGLDEINAIHDMAIDRPGEGLGAQVVETIMASTYDGVRVIDVLPQSERFWDRLGAGNYDIYKNTTLDFEGSPAEARFRHAGSARVRGEAKTGTTGPGQEVRFSTPREVKSFDEEYPDAESLIQGLARGDLLVHARVPDGTDFEYGIDPSAGELLRSTEAWQTAEEETGEGPELTFFSGDLLWAKSDLLKTVRAGDRLELVFVRKNEDIQQSLGDGRVRLADGKIVRYEMSPLADYENPLFKDEPAGVERGDWYTNKTQEVVAVASADAILDTPAKLSTHRYGGLPESATPARPLDDTGLRALRRAAAGLERPQDGIFLSVTDDGKAIAAGPKGARIPDAFRRFAHENGLTFYAERKDYPNPKDGIPHSALAGTTTPYGGLSGASTPMPIAYRESGARYFGETGRAGTDRTDKTRFSRERLEKLRTTSITDNGILFETGKPVTFPYLHNKESATQLFGIPRKDSPFDRGFEPSGKYVTLSNSARLAEENPQRYEAGALTFHNPLVLDGERWKPSLSKAFGNLRGKRLSQALIDAGFDGVVTTDRGEASEILDLTSFDPKLAKYSRERLAPNGEPSRLNERQWEQVRTPAFRIWFGNWNYDPTTPVKITQISGKEIGEGPLSASRIKDWILREQRWQDRPPVINADTGNAIGFTVQGVKDSLKRKAYAGLRDLLEHAVFVDFEPIREGKSNEGQLQGYEVYYGALEIDGERFGVRLKVELPKKETSRDRAYKGHKIVDVEVRSPAASLGSDTSAPGVGDPGSVPTQAGGSTISLGQLVGENKPQASKIVDANGEPLVVYHGTKGDFSVFKNVGGVVSTIFGKEKVDRQGFFFTDSPLIASEFAEQGSRPTGSNVIPAFLSITSPLDFREGYFSDNILDQFEADGISVYWLSRFSWEHLDGENGKIFVEAARRLGYDGVLFREDDINGYDKFPVYVAFEPEQIKSAIGNNGAFDSTNQDIQYSRAREAIFDGSEVAKTPLTPGAKTLPVDGIERPALNNLGKPIHWSEEGVRNFWRWFGDSETVDEQGRPMMVYHGTSADFNRFSRISGGGSTLAKDARKAFFFTTSPEVAEDFSGYQYTTHDGRSVEKVYDNGASLMPVYIRSVNPEVWSMGGGSYSESWMTDAIRSAKRDKKDGVVFQSMRDGSVSTVGPWKRSHVIAVFDPTQIKSASGNNGDFSRDNRDIRFSRVRKVGDTPIIENPTRQQARTLLDRSEYKEIRGLQDPETGKIWVWDAARLLHEQAAHGLGLSEEYFSRLQRQTDGHGHGLLNIRHLEEGDYPYPIFSGERKTDARFSRHRANLGDLTTAQAQAANHVLGTPKTLTERLADFKKDWAKNLKQGIFDQFAPIAELDQNAYIQARLSKGGDSTLEALMLYGKLFVGADGATDVRYTQAGKMQGFASKMAKLNGEHDRFLLWVAAQRADRLKGIGLENLWSDTDIAELKTLNQGNQKDGTARAPLFAQAMADLNEFNDNVLEVAEASGLIDSATRQLYQNTPYVPFYRLQEDDSVQGFGITPGLVNQYAWKRLKGGTQKLNEDLMANLLHNWSHLITASAKNRAAKSTLDAAVRAGIAQPVATSMGQYATSNGVLLPPGTKGQVSYREAGTETPFVVSDPHLLEAVAALHYSGLGPWAKPLSTAKHWLTVGVTTNPAFKLRNLIRDTIGSLGTADLSYRADRNLVQGWRATGVESETRAHMLASGGMIRFGSMLDGRSSQRAEDLIHQGVNPAMILDSDSKIQAFWKRHVAPALSAYNELGDRTENVNRAALYEQLIQKGLTHAEASYWARDLMDFSMGGKWTAIRTLVQTVPFFNARLQGLYKLGRAGKQDLRRLGTVLGAVSLASLALMFAGEDDEDWKARSDSDRNNYWWFKVGGHAFRVPKPFEIGAVGTLAERGYELMFNPEMTSNRFGRNLRDLVMNQLSMNPVPQLFKPMMEIYANKDSFTGKDIESMGLERLQKADRFDEHSSEVAKFLGKLGLPDPAQFAMGRLDTLSPKQVDHLAKGYFSWLATMTTTILDYGIRPMINAADRPDRQLKDIFFVGNFVESLPSNQSRYLTQMYDQAREIEQAYASYQARVKAGDFAGAKAFREDHIDLFKRRPATEQLKKASALLNIQIQRVTNSRKLTGEEKRTRLDMLYQRRNHIAERFQAV